MYGLPEESSGCKVKGKLVLKNKVTITAKYLSFVFVGKITVACGPPMSTSRPEYCETQIICKKEYLFHDSNSTGKKILAGEHGYPFEFDIPGHLPSSFKGKRGKIEYYCNACLSRPMLHNDVDTKKIICLRRSLLNDTRAAQTHHTTFNEGQLLDGKISYQISTPIMTFREGGLVQTELTLKSSDPNIVIEDVEYGLKEQIHYRTTGEQANAVIANVDEENYPFGRKSIKVDPNDTDPIKINFRLYPRVNCDVDSQLININHKLSFTAFISKTIDIEHESFPGEVTNQRNNRRLSVPISSQLESRDSGRMRRTTSLLPPTRAIANTRTRPARHSRTFSLSSLMGPPRPPLLTKVEKKLIRFEIPIIVTTKSYKSRPSTPHSFDNVDRPPAYAIASMIPPPPEYVPDSPEFLNDYLEGNEFIVYDDDI